MLRKSVKNIGWALIILGIVSFVGLANAGQVTMNIGYATPENHNYGVLTKKFKALVEEYTNGTVQVKLFCCSQLGTEDGAFKSLQLGTIDAFIITINNISPHYPLTDVFVLPYIFQNQEHLLKVLDGPVGKQFFEKMRKKTKVHFLSFGPVVYRDMYVTKRAINKFEDFSGLKYRVPKNRVFIETYKAFGAEPVPIAWSEAPTALQTGTVDGGDNGTDTIKAMKFYEFAKHLVILDHFVAFSPLLASNRFMSKLDEKQKAAVMKAAQEANTYTNKIALKATEEIRSFLASKGMAITRPDRTKFIEAAMKVQDKFAEERGEEFKATLMKIRAEAK